MPTQYITRRSTALPAITKPNAAAIYVDSDDNRLKFIPAGSGSTEVEISQLPTPSSAVVNTTLSAATHGFRTIIANKIDGITFTLPAATGSGVKFKIVVGTTLTSGSFVLVVADATDFLRGRAIFSNDTDGSASNFETANTGTLATESDTMTWNRTTTGVGTIGDLVEVEDIATDIWSVTAHVQATGVEATPFTAAV
jgi:hypothetical protein